MTRFKSCQTILFIILFLCLSVVWGQDFKPNPDPHRFQSEIDAFTSWDAKNSFATGAFLFTGSSSIRLWKTHEAFPDIVVLNRGFGGSHISDVLFYFDRIIPKYQPSVIVFYAGDNDIADGKPVDQVFKDFSDLLSRVRVLSETIDFIYLPIKPSGLRWALWEKMNAFNIKIRDTFSRDSNFIYMDTATPMLNPSTKQPDPELYMSDHLHLNEKGYQIWTEISLS